jgi:hypothetical protein
MIAARARAGPVTGGLRWRVDPRRSEATVAGSHLGAPWVNGLIRGIAGELILDPVDPRGSSFAVRAPRERVYVGDPRLNTQLRLGDLLGERPLINFDGVLDEGPGGYSVDLCHTLPGLGSPLPMAVELLSASTLALPALEGEPAWGWRVSLTARPLGGLERLTLHLEADLAEAATAVPDPSGWT